jgi:hypothetical protein
MVSPRPGRKRYVASALLALLPGTGAMARVLELDIGRIETALGTLEGVALRLDWPDAAATGALELRVASLDAGDLGYRYEALRWRCPMTLERAARRVVCRGELRAADPPRHAGRAMAGGRAHGRAGRGPWHARRDSAG